MRDPNSIGSRNPEPDSKSPLPVRAPLDPYSTQELNIADYLDASNPESPLTVSTTGSDRTQKLARPKLEEPPIRVQKVDQPTAAAGQTQNRPFRPEAPSRSIPWKLPLGLSALMVLGAAAYLVFSRGPAAQPLPPPLAASPQASASGAQNYLEQAVAGDAHAMRMLGVMYYYGLNVPQDREKGLSWYRKAAEKGSDAARSELSKIEGGR
jgi:hypothetical protein